MDFNPVNYFGRNFSLIVSDGVGFVFYWRGGFYVFEVVLMFKDNRAVFVLYERVYGLDGLMLDANEQG